jgi:hypothetical protein
MTTEQTKRVCDRVLTLTRDWMLDRNASNGRYGGASAFADFDLDCYVGMVDFVYSTANGQTVSGELLWRLDNSFEPEGPPEVLWER